jgi:hypothetical protein
MILDRGSRSRLQTSARSHAGPAGGRPAGAPQGRFVLAARATLRTPLLIFFVTFSPTEPVSVTFAELLITLLPVTVLAAVLIGVVVLIVKAGRPKPHPGPYAGYAPPPGYAPHPGQPAHPGQPPYTGQGPHLPGQPYPGQPPFAGQPAQADDARPDEQPHEDERPRHTERRPERE